MDYLAHGLWSYILFHKIKKIWYAIFFGLLPDNLSWTIFLIYNLIIGKGLGPPVPTLIPGWVFTLYNISHSLIITAIVFLAIFLIYKKIPIYMYAWPAAIIIDIFTHTRDFLPTPFLWPLSEWRFPGISWASLAFMSINYIIIITLLIYIQYKRRRKTL